MSIDDLSPLSPSIFPVLDAFFVLLLKAEEFTLLPDLLSALGPEGTVKFLDLFSDTTIQVPTRDELERFVRDAQIYTGLAKGTEKASTLAERYGISLAEVERTFEEVARAVEEHGK